MKYTFLVLIFSWALTAALASPSDIVDRSVAPDNIVYVTDAKKHWFVNLLALHQPLNPDSTPSMIMPRTPHTNIGDSEHPGGMKTYCTPAGRYDSRQGQLPADFWRNIEFKKGTGKNGGRFAQGTFRGSTIFVSVCALRPKR